MRKSVPAVLATLALLVVSARAQTTYTVTWVSQGTNNSIPGTTTYVNPASPSTFYDYGQFPCTALGLMLTSINSQTLSTQPAYFGYSNTQVPDSGDYFCTGAPEFPQGKGALGLPLSAFPPGAPQFTGGNMSVGWTGYQPGTNPAYPSADTYVIYTLATQDANPWTGSVTQWFHGETTTSCGRGGCHKLTFYKELGGYGSMSATQ